MISMTSYKCRLSHKNRSSGLQTATFDREPDFGDGEAAAPYGELEPYAYSEHDAAGSTAQTPSAGAPACCGAKAGTQWKMASVSHPHRTCHVLNLHARSWTGSRTRPCHATGAWAAHTKPRVQHTQRARQAARRTCRAAARWCTTFRPRWPRSCPWRPASRCGWALP